MRYGVPLMLLALVLNLTLLAGCQRVATERDELPWLMQIERGRTGESDEIVVLKQTIHDDDLRLLVDLPGLKTLVLDQTDLTDAAAEQIAKLVSLTRLNVGASRWTNHAAGQIAKLPQLENLLLGSCAIDDHGLAQLTQLKMLRFLILRELPITDGALPTLRSLTRLESLYLSGTQITESMLAQLQAERPKLHVHGP